MKKIFVIMLVAFALAIAISSCTSSKFGCKANSNMVGYH